MAKAYSITFSIDGNENLSAAIKSAQNALKGLSNKTIAAANKLANDKSLLHQIGNYRQLQQAIRATQQARAQELLQQSRLMAQRKQATQQLADMRKAYGQLQDYYKANRRSMGSEAANTFKEQLSGARAEIKAQQKLISGLDRNFDKSSVTADKLRGQLAAQQQQLTQLRTTLPAGALAGHEAQLRAQIQATTNALNAEIAALERRNQIHANFANAQQNLANAYSNFQNAVGTAETIMNPFKDAAQNAITFEKGMSRLKSLTQMRNLRAGDLATVNKEMASMQSTIENLGMTTEFTANEIAGAANKYAMSGWTQKMIEAMLPTTTDLASISQLPMDRVADMLSDDMTAFGIKAGEGYKLASGKVVDGAKFFGDAVAYATTQANMDFTTFHEAWKYNAPVAHAMRLSLGEAIAQNMILANAGIKGSMGGTSLRQFWVRMSAPPKAAQKSLEAMGMAASDASKQIAETWEALNEAGVSTNSDLFTRVEAVERYYQEGLRAGKDMTGWLKALTGQTALSGVQTLFDLGAMDKARQYKEEIDSGWIQGWAGDTARVMRDNTETSIKYLESAADALQRNAGDALTPTIRAAADAFTPLIQSAAEFVKAHPQVVQACAAIAAAIASIIVAAAGFSVIMAGIRFFTAGLQTAGLVFGGLGGKIAGVLSSIMMFPVKHPALLALATVATLIYANWDKVSGVISKVFNSLNAAIPELKAGHFSAAADAFKAAWLGAVDTVKQAVNSIGETPIGALNADIFNRANPFAATQPQTIGEVAMADSSPIQIAAEQAAQSILAGGEISAQAIQSGGEIQAQTLTTSSEAAAMSLETINNPAQTLSFSLMMASPATEALAFSAQSASASNDALSASSQNAASGADMLGASSSNATGGIDAMSGAAAGSTGNISSMSGAASSASGALGGLAGAVSSAIGALMSAGASAASAVSAAASSAWSSIKGAVGIGQNATGGIYSKGAFLTTFAENSPEAAIPIDNSARAKSLWLETGNLLGMTGGDNFSLNLTVNISGSADRNDVQEGIYSALPSFRDALREFEHERRRRAYV